MDTCSLLKEYNKPRSVSYLVRTYLPGDAARRSRGRLYYVVLPLLSSSPLTPDEDRCFVEARAGNYNLTVRILLPDFTDKLVY